MKIAVTSAGPDLGSTVESRFGRCPYFLIIESDTMEFESIENPNIALGGGAGIQSAQMMAEKGVQTVLTGNCGPNAFRTFGAAGIQVITGVSGMVRQAVEQFRAGVFSSATSPNVSSHFGMGMNINASEQSFNRTETGGSMQGGMGGGRGMGRGMGGGRGMGRGMGGGQGMGMGGGRGMAAGMPGGLQPTTSARPDVQQQAAGMVSREQELAMLKEQAKIMNTQLNEINARISDLDKGGQGPGLIAYVEAEACKGCSRCLPVCPLAAIVLADNVAQVDNTKCTGCGLCVVECPNNALSLKKA